MNKQEFLESMTYLGLAYGKDYTEEEIKQHYDFLKDYNDITFTEAVKKLIKTSKFLPKISDLIEACESSKQQIKFEVIEYMNSVGYFKDIKEYEKTNLFLEKGIIPSWLQEDFKKYYKMMVNNKIAHNKQQLLNDIN